MKLASGVAVAAALVALSVAGIGGRQAATAKEADLPKESYERQPEQPFSSSDYVFKLDQMISFYDVPGEFGHAMEGAPYGFESLSFIITETQPGGGPPLHVHESEEAHVVLEGKATWCSAIKSSLSKGRMSQRSPRAFRIHLLMRARNHCA